MTTKPKARKYRIKRTAPNANAVETADTAAPQPEAATAEPVAPTPSPAAEAPSEPAPAPAEAPRVTPTPDIASPAQVGSENTIDAIRREGLTGRQLRMARRVAQKHGLPATSDFDAVRLLRDKGIDPFQRSNMLELVVPPGQEGAAPAQPRGAGRAQLPQTVTPQESLPALDESMAEKRAREVRKIQVDMARRRKRKLVVLFARLAFFVLLPTLLAGYYFYSAATPMYSNKSEFLILQADASGGRGGIGGLLSGTQFATNGDSIATQSYLQSKDAMLRLDNDAGFKAHFKQDWIDPIQRMNPDASNEDAYKVYKKRVKIGYDPTEGVIRMEVVAADPAVSQAFSERLIAYAEERVNELSQQKRADSMRDARDGFEKAQQERRNAQEALVRLQVENSALDPEGIIGSMRGLISNVDQLILEKELALAALQDNARPNRAKVAGVEADIQRLQLQRDKLNAQMTQAQEGENSLAEKAVRIQMAEADLVSRDLMLQSAIEQMEATRAEANRQVRYLTVAVKPVTPESASYPRAFENTFLAFVIFAGVYLLISLTAAILREQVGA